MKYRKIGIVVADGCEFEPLRRLENTQKSVFQGMECIRFSVGQIEVCALLCGIGKVNAAAAAAFLVCDGAELLVSTGWSGGIHGISKGMTAIATRFLEHDFDLTPLGYEKAQKPDQQWIYDADFEVNAVFKRLYPDLKEGTMVSGDCFVCDAQLRNELSEKYDAISCDMESAAVASVGFKSGVPVVALRRISDDAGDSANEMYTATCEIYETAMIDMVLAAVLALSEVE